MAETVTLTREETADDDMGFAVHAAFARNGGLVKAGVRIPAPDHVERAARLVAVAHGEPEDYWKTHKTEARAILMVVMNLDKVERGL